MSFTRASFCFAAHDQNPATTLFIPQDGHLSRAVNCLRATLLDGGTVLGDAFQEANLGYAFGASNQTGISFRYTFAGDTVQVEELCGPGEAQWKEISNGPVLELVNAHGPMLHALGPAPLGRGRVQYATLETLEAQYAQAEARRLRQEEGIVAMGAGWPPGRPKNCASRC